jgi:hypothetical protein
MNIFVVWLAAVSLVGSSPADEASSLMGQCFARDFDEAYLAEHPNQKLKTMKIGFTEFEGDSALARIDLVTHAPFSVFYYFARCSRDVSSGMICEGCSGESCDVNGETFRIGSTSRDDRIEFVNTTTGITAKGLAGAWSDFRLAAVNPYRVIALDRVDASFCPE